MAKVVEAHNVKFSQVLGNKKGELPKYEFPIYFGIELEYEVNTPSNLGSKEARHIYRAQIAERIQHTYQGFAFAKHDGSLANGFEIVSIPMSRDAHATQWIPLLEIARENGLQIRNTCGMHVHVSRELLTPLQIGKMLAFVCNPKHAEFLKSIAGRKPPIIKSDNYPAGKAYADMSPKKITDVNKHRERYSALNLTNSDTVEFRIFKGTLNLNHMMKNIEFCDALVRFCWPGGEAGIQEIKENGLQAFFDFVAQIPNRKRFPYLAQFMKDNNYITWAVKKVSKIGLAKLAEMQKARQEAENEKATLKEGKKRRVAKKTLTKVRGKITKKKIEKKKPAGVILNDDGSFVFDFEADGDDDQELF